MTAHPSIRTITLPDAATGRDTVRVAAIIDQSIVDGPGLRLTVFTQGCPHGCPECHNPGTHSFSGGQKVAVDDIIARIDENPLLAGVTLSGGEPFAQPGALVELCSQVRQRGKTVWCFTGFTFEELLARSATTATVRQLLQRIDVLVDGRYEHRLRDISLLFRGSANQRILDVPASLKEERAVVMR